MGPTERPAAPGRCDAGKTGGDVQKRRIACAGQGNQPLGLLSLLRQGKAAHGLQRAVGSGLGLLVGVTAGARGGRVDAILMRFVDAMLAIPILPLLLLASAMAIGTGPGGARASTLKLAVLLGLFGWMSVARIARAETMRTMQLDFVVAARALGSPWLALLRRHVLPNVMPAVLVATTLDVGRNILAESALSFLGLGVQPPTPSWGNMLRHAENAIANDSRLAFWPGALILVTVVCVYVLGEAVRAALDPRQRRSDQSSDQRP